MPRHAKRTFILLALLSSVAAPKAMQGPEMITGLSAGPFGVAFHREWILDSTRVWAQSDRIGAIDGPVARPIRIDVWYPSTGGACRRTTLRDFLYAQAPDAYFGSANAHIQKWDEDSLRGYARALNISFDRLLSPVTRACLDGAVRPGRYPLVIYSGGWYNRSPDNIALAEYLASFGYVVAEVPLFGAGLWTGDLTSNPTALETQARDLEASIGALSAHEWVDRTHVAAMGYSSGGIVALFLGGRHPLVDAVIGLDPSYGSDTAKVLGATLFNADAFHVPLLTLRAGHASYVARDRSAVLAALTHADRYTADVGLSTHGDFGDDVMLEATLNLKRAELQFRTAAEGLAAYQATVSAIRLFLDGALREQPAALDALMASAGTTLRLTKTPAVR